MDYEKIYHELGFKVEPLPNNYDPDLYAKKLMRDVNYPKGVVYAVSTEDLNADEFLIKK